MVEKELKGKLTEIKVKVEKLVYLHREHSRQNIALKSQVAQLNAKMEEQQLAITQLTDKIKILKLAGAGNLEKEENQQLRNKINGLIREVDKCISLLNA